MITLSFYVNNLKKSNLKQQPQVNKKTKTKQKPLTAAYLPQTMNFMKVEFPLEMNQNPAEAEVEVSRVVALCKRHQQTLLYYRKLEVEHIQV